MGGSCPSTPPCSAKHSVRDPQSPTPLSSPHSAFTSPLVGQPLHAAGSRLRRKPGAEQAEVGLGEGCTSGFLAQSPHSFPVSARRWGLRRGCWPLSHLTPHSNRTHPGRKTGRDLKVQNLILGSPPRLLPNRTGPRWASAPLTPARLPQQYQRGQEGGDERELLYHRSCPQGTGVQELLQAGCLTWGQSLM